MFFNYKKYYFPQLQGISENLKHENSKILVFDESH